MERPPDACPVSPVTEALKLACALCCLPETARGICMNEWPQHGRETMEG